MGLVGNLGNEAMQPCIDVCIRCSQACQECLTLCLTAPDVNNRINCIKMLQDCIDICYIASKFMIRGSGHAKHICKECAEICTQCAKDCQVFGDDHCKKCADICNQCASECNKMAS